MWVDDRVGDILHCLKGGGGCVRSVFTLDHKYPRLMTGWENCWQTAFHLLTPEDASSLPFILTTGLNDNGKVSHQTAVSTTTKVFFRAWRKPSTTAYPKPFSGWENEVYLQYATTPKPFSELENMNEKRRKKCKKSRKLNGLHKRVETFWRWRVHIQSILTPYDFKLNTENEVLKKAFSQLF